MLVIISIHWFRPVDVKNEYELLCELTDN
jgi:hypothetical protein